MSIGEQLLAYAETYAKNILQLKSLFLLSNTKNAAALRLYERAGCTVNHTGPHPVYERADIGMVKQL